VPYTLLLADDSVTIQRVIELTFADEDVDVVAVSDGDQAIARLDASPPDIVLADIGMPGKNGYEVAQYIRQTPRLAHIPVVLLTGAFEPVDQARAAAAGCDGVLAKPFEPQLVIGRVKELLAKASRLPDALAADAPPPSSVPGGQWAPPPAVPPAAAPPAEANTPLALDDYFDRLDAAFANVSSPSVPAPPAPPGGEIDWFGTTAAGTPGAEPWDLPAPADRDEPSDLPLTHAAPPPPSSFDAFADQASADMFPQAAAPESNEPTTLEEFAPDAVAEPVAPEAAHYLDALAVALTSTDTSHEHLADFAPDAPSATAAPSDVVAPSAPVVSPAPAAPPAPVAVDAPAAPARAAELPALADAFAALLAAEQGEPLPARAPFWPGTAKAASSDTGARPFPAIATPAFVEDVTRRVVDALSDQVIRETVAEIVSRVAEQLVREEIERIKASIK